MNIKNVKKLRDFIAKLPPQAVYMPEYITLDRPNETLGTAAQHTCGTRACIAGWACLALLPKTARFKRNETRNPSIRLTPRGRLERIPRLAARLLGLEYEPGNYLNSDARLLYEGHWAECGLFNITKTDVLKQLDRMIKTGEV